MTSRTWRRIICVLLCMAVLLPCITAAAEETTKITVHLLRLRETPSTKAKVLDAYPKGTKVTILKKGDTWTKVKVHGKTGYMQTAYLAYGRKQSSSTGGTVVPGKITTGSTAYIIKGVKLNLREEANINSDVIASFRGGTEVTVLKKGKYWSLVEVKGLVGYMGTNYLTEEKVK